MPTYTRTGITRLSYSSIRTHNHRPYNRVDGKIRLGMKNAWQAGASASEIASAFNVDTATVYRVASDKMRHFLPVTEEEKEGFIAMRIAGNSIRYIAEAYHRSVKTVEKYLEPHNLLMTHEEKSKAISRGIHKAYLQRWDEAVHRGYIV